MSGGGYQKRRRADAIRAAKMKAEGCTTKDIAAALGLKQEQVKARVELGQRLLSLELADTDDSK